MRPNSPPPILQRNLFTALADKTAWIRTLWISRNLAAVMLFGAVVSSVVTYISITESNNPFGPDPKQALGLVLLNLIFLLGLALVVSWKLIRLWLARKKGYVGSRLQGRIIMLFSLVSAVPTIIIAMFSTIFFNLGIQTWFDERVATALEESVAVAEGYLNEHKNIIRADVLAMASDLNRQSYQFYADPQLFNNVVNKQAAIRALTEALVFQKSTVLAKTNLSFSLMFEVEKITPEMLDRADKGEVVVLTSDIDDRVRALVKLDGFFDTYLFVGRLIDSKVIEHMARTQGSVTEYQRLRSGIGDLQIRFFIIFIAVALLLMLASIWFGIVFADQLVNPISILLSATERVKSGDLDVRVKEGPKDDEIWALAAAFNRMTNQLKKQRDELVEIGMQADSRRRFIEAVLLGVSAGVIALNRKKQITVFNRSAAQLLSIPFELPEATHANDIFPEVIPLLKEAEKRSQEHAQEEVHLTRNNRKSTFLVRIVTERLSDEIDGYVITFDDITELQAAQRTAAWADVARRIAHEIKNPLTPIHLAAERLKRKFSKQVEAPTEFTKYTDTIVRHVGDIGNIVEEFVQFARMPTATLSKMDLVKVIRDQVFSEQVLDNDIRFLVTVPEKPVWIKGDERQLGQALGNLLKNAREALENSPPDRTKKSHEHRIEVMLSEDDYVFLNIEDNGAGFSPEILERATEPYVTTRSKGTGLGLAIVKKIIDDHEGKILITNKMDTNGKITGAKIILSFPKFSK